MTNPDRKTRGRPRSVKSDRAILQATLELLAEVGFEALSIEGIAARAGVGKTTIYRRYSSKEELVADAIESMRAEIILPDTGNFQTDLDALIDRVAQMVLTPASRQAIAKIVSSAIGNPQFARIYQTKYLEPRRKDFAVIIERAKLRNEIAADIDADRVFDLISGIMLYVTIFPPNSEAWSSYVGNILKMINWCGDNLSA